MVVVDRAYAGGAASTIINTAMTATVPGIGGTISVTDDSGYPSSGKFEIVVDRTQPNEENILISSRSGTTFTIGQRGYDGSVASAHVSGEATCEADLSGRTVQLFVDHVDDVETAPHSTKLPVGTTAGHDVTARHQFGAAFAAPATPTALTPDIAGNAGAAAGPARADHAHNVPAAVPVAVGTALAEGAGSSFARDNHVHVVGVGAINAANMFAAGVVDAAAIATDAVDTAEIAANAVTASEIAANAVGSSELANDAVDTAAIQDDAVTPAKMSTIGDWDLAQLADDQVSGGDVYADWTATTITFTNPGIAVKIAAFLTGRADQTGGGGSNVINRAQVGISVDGGGSFTFGQPAIEDNADAGANRSSAFAAQHYRSATPTGNIVIKAQNRADDADAQFREGSLFAMWKPVT